MKIALCTTTIHVPHALKLMRKCSGEVRFFVAFDKKTPSEIYAIADGDTKMLPEAIQSDWKCSEALGWNTIARRNIAFLEALKWGADVIYSWDNDNLNVDTQHFENIGSRFEYRRGELNSAGTWMYAGGEPKLFNGIKISGPNGWFDPGSLLIPQTRHRGIPWSHRNVNHAGPVTDVKIGVVAGLVIGDPDIDAVTRMEHRPDIGGVHLLGQTGIVVDPHTWTVFNSQNTAVIRELIPAWFMMSGVGRHDDIYASLIVQRVARERNLHVHFGPPFTYQQRNEHNLITDLRREIDGMENVAVLAELLDHIPLPGKSVIEDTRTIYSTLEHCDWLPDEAIYAAHKWLDDCESVL
jgi:hypothetical protein